jgi:NADH-quinone oxidoreductase subunit N
MEPIVPPSLGDSLLLAAPMVITSLVGLVLMIYSAVARPLPRTIPWAIATGGLLLAGVVAVAVQGLDPIPAPAFSGMLQVDGYGVFFELVVILAAVLALLLSESHLDRLGVRVGEYYALVLLGVTGMILMGFASDLVMIFVALEVMSIAMYILCAIKRADERSVESGFKYFVLGAFSSAIMLYGIALLYGAVGSTGLDALRDRLHEGLGAVHVDGLLAVGAALVLVGFGFKVAAVPFHAWTPDVYQGAPTSVTALMAGGVKVASFAALGRVAIGALAAEGQAWTSALWWMAAATMLVGNLAALVQRDLKRLLAYSSIAHAGYLLMAVVAAPAGVEQNPALGSLGFYLLAYTLMNAGAFAVVALLVREGHDASEIDALAGLGRRAPWRAAGLTICLFSLAGVPPTMGFVGKFYLFSAAVAAGHTGLAVVGAVGAAAGVYYYLRPIVVMYFHEGDAALDRDLRSEVALALAVAGTLVFGLLPSGVLAWAEASVRSLAG